MYKKESLNGVEYYFDGSKFANAAEYVASIAGIELDAPYDNQQVLKSLTVAGKTWHNVPRSGAKNYGLTEDQFDIYLAEQSNAELFESEKLIAIKIIQDFNLGTGEHEITGEDMKDVRAYIQSIDPAKGLKAGHLQRAKIPRPSIFDRYKTNPYEL